MNDNCHGTPSQSCHPAACQPQAADDRGQLTVLVVDDDQDFLLQQKLQLESAGFRVVTAGGETQAMETLAEAAPDLAVLDLMMENDDGGFTLCYRIKKQLPSLPVIIVSSVNAETGLDFGTETDGQRSWIKADAFLSKPIRFEQLKREIDRLTGDHR